LNARSVNLKKMEQRQLYPAVPQINLIAVVEIVLRRAKTVKVVMRILKK
jgi:hypothetical protein